MSTGAVLRSRFPRGVATAQKEAERIDASDEDLNREPDAW